MLVGPGLNQVLGYTLENEKLIEHNPELLQANLCIKLEATLDTKGVPIGLTEEQFASKPLNNAQNNQILPGGLI